MKGWVSAIAAVVVLTGQAVAQPEGFHVQDGHWKTADGKFLYLYASSRIPDAKILCGSECPDATAAPAAGGPGRWEPVFVQAGASVTPPWTSAPSEGGAQLAYRGTLLFTHTSTTDREPGAARWRRLPAVETFRQVDDPLLAAKPAHDPGLFVPPEYPPASLRAKETGAVGVMFCVDERGRGLFPKVIASSGSARLDYATTEWVWRDFRVTPARVNETRVGVCGYTLTLDWTLPPPKPPEPRQ